MINRATRAGAVLLAAGRGTRLRPLTDVVPKPALPLLDVPLAAFGLESLRRAAIRPLINLSHLAASAERALRPFAPEGLWLNEPPEPFGTAGTLREADARGLLDPTFVVWNGDVVADVDPGELLEEHRRSGAGATIVVHPVNAGADFVVAGGRATSFIDRRERMDAPGVRFAGISAMSSSALSVIPSAGPAGIGESILRPLTESGEVAVVVTDVPVLDVGTVGAFLVASQRLLDRHPVAPRPPGAVTGVPGGRAYLGPGSRAAPGVMGPGAVLLRASVAEAGARIERAVVWPGDHVAAGALVEDCVWFKGRPLRAPADGAGAR